VSEKVNGLYKLAYKHYIDPASDDNIDTSRFAPERIKSIVQQLEGMALTKGSALNSDIMGAFFEEILRAGFKQDRGMYFTHDNIARFMVEAVGLQQLTRDKWRHATHPENRLPYVIDPACGSGTFLLHAMHTITDTVQRERAWFAQTDNDEIFLNQSFSHDAPNGWAKDFLYGLDPKFIMAITAKLNMVLHGDGVAHLFKDDAYKPMDSYNDGRLRPIGTSDRSLSSNIYSPAMCEMFDVVVSNPPFGVTLANETRHTLPRAFTLPETYSTEALFIERAFQLLRPKGRLAVVLPESVLNAADTGLRLFLMRMFHIRAVVTMPRHIFVDTPTLTSLLFAQKKTGVEIAQWDQYWAEEESLIEAKVAAARRHLTNTGRKAFVTAADLEDSVLRELKAVGGRDSWVMRRGSQNGGQLGFALPQYVESVVEGVKHYQALLQTPGFQDLVSQSTFAAVASRLDTDWPCYAVAEVGFKLSKRGERLRENHLAAIIHQGGRRPATLQPPLNQQL
jgi:type I restriction enzyme M protein